jgi:hypothetical protein
MIAKVKNLDFSAIKPKIADICANIDQISKVEIVSKIKEIIPEYRSNNSEYEILDKELLKNK